MDPRIYIKQIAGCAHSYYTLSTNFFGLMKFYHLNSERSYPLLLLPKKGNQTECKNWRGIILLSMINKKIAHIINKELSGYISPKIRNELYSEFIDQ